MKGNRNMLVSFRDGASKALFVLMLLSLFCAAGFGFGQVKALASEPGLSIQDVRVSQSTLRAGEEVMIFYRLTENATVSVYVYDPDYAVVRRLMDGIARPAGTNTLVWDGRDDSGDRVPDEGYVFTIVAEGKNGGKAVYDPTTHSGGEILSLGTNRVEKSAGNYILYYSVPVPARICIKAGVHKGPMLKTILDWKSLPPEDYVETWDGMDETGRIRVMDEPGSILYIKGFELPENTILVQGGDPDYPSYHQRILARSADGTTGLLAFESVRSAATLRRKKGISPEYLVPRALNRAPKFYVYRAQKFLGGSGRRAAGVPEVTPLAETGVTQVSGMFDVTMEVAPESMRNFNESRYEIVVFVDNKRFDEEETAYSPYTYSLDTSRLANGEHAVTINLVSITGQVGAYSFVIYVNNQQPF